MRHSAIARLLRDTITVTTAAGVDEFGQPLTTTADSVKARVVRNHTRSRDETGLEFLSTTQVQTLHPVSVGDTLTIDGAERPVRATKSAHGTRGGITLYEAHL